jgi:hypothetical protein
MKKKKLEKKEGPIKNEQFRERRRRRTIQRKKKKKKNNPEKLATLGKQDKNKHKNIKR